MIDYIFHGPPTGGVSGPAVALDVTNGTLYYTIPSIAGWVAISGGGGGGGLLLSRSVTLTDAQIKALPTTPLQLLAPTPGKRYLPVLCALEINALAAVYTNVATVNASSYLSLGTAITPDDNEVSSFLFSIDLGGGNGFDSFGSLFGVDVGTVVFRSTQTQAMLTPTILGDGLNQVVGDVAQNFVNGEAWDGLGLYLIVNNSNLGNFTGGDPANSMKINLYYMDAGA